MNRSESEVNEYLSLKGIPYVQNIGSMHLLDFELYNSEHSQYYRFDVKEKNQPYNVRNWNVEIPEEYFFIINDLAARKVLAAAPRIRCSLNATAVS